MSFSRRVAFKLKFLREHLLSGIETIPLALTSHSRFVKFIEHQRRPSSNLAQLIFVIAFVSTPNLQAQTNKFVDDYQQKISAAKQISALDENLFGDSTNEYIGSVNFAVTDIDIPGNNALPVSLAREFQAINREGNSTVPVEFKSIFGDWDWAIPHMRGVYGPNGRSAMTATTANRRCGVSSLAEARPPQTEFFSPAEYWQGNHLHLPGQGDQEVLYFNGTNKPSDGGVYRWVTKERWYFSCLPSTANGVAGDAFLARSPDGNKYWFNHIVQRKARAISKPVIVNDFDGGFTVENIPLARFDVLALPTRIEDRFGNWTAYTYDVSDPWRLLKITSSDGRNITLTYNTNGRVTSVTDGTRVWGYTYTGTGIYSYLSTVTLPDTSKWIYDFSQLNIYRKVGGLNSTSCGVAGTLYSVPRIAKITHPSGAKGEFTFKNLWHGRSYVTKLCTNIQNPSDGSIVGAFDAYPVFFSSLSLTSKQITGHGLSIPKVWTWQFPSLSFSYVNNCPGSGCVTTKTINITQPDGSIRKKIYGTHFGVNDGLLLQSDQLSSSSVVLTSSIFDYVTDATGQSYPNAIGTSAQVHIEPDVARPKPIYRKQILQQGVSFTSQIASSGGVYRFDEFAKPLEITRTSVSSTGTTSRTELYSYENQLSSWMIGQLKTVTNASANPAVVVSQTIYDPSTSLPLQKFRFGQLESTMTYFADGTVASIKDARNNTTSLSNYKRGIPQAVGFADGTSISGSVNNIGELASTVDQLGSTWSYTYDAMGRLASTTPPSGDNVAWLGSTQSFAPNNVAAYGLPIGHWKQTIIKGNFRKEVYFNAMWQPVVTREYDVSNISGTERFTRVSYNTKGRTAFVSYPGSTDSLTTGVRSQYDALDRVTKTEQDSELGILNTTIEYLDNFQTRVTSPRGSVTTTGFQVFDEPDTSRPEIIMAPEGVTTTILRDSFGKPLEVSRSGIWSGSIINTTRQYVYDVHQRLCKRIEPETGATLFDYDDTNNIAWFAQGSPLTSATCDREGVATVDKSVFTYDQLNRLKTTDIPGTAEDLSYGYFDDGSVKFAINGLTRWDYTYNKLRLPVNETLTIDGRVKTLAHEYNSMAQESSLAYPSGLVVANSPNALGQASQAGTFATSVSYFRNSGMSGFVYGNGIVHSMTQNARMLPLQSKDMDGSIAILDDTYAFDENGNVASIVDGTSGNGGNRTMTYDEADRLTSTYAPNQWWIYNNFTYDALDNIRNNTLGYRNHTYQYDSTARLVRITKPWEETPPPNLMARNSMMAAASGGGGGGTNPPPPITVRNLNYDSQGNVIVNGSQSYTVDKANRMQSVVGKESYQYDAHGRRVKIIRAIDGKVSYPMYSREGKLIADEDQRSNNASDYVYLNGSLVAVRSATIGTTNYATSYQHTDSLSSPVATSDALKTVTYIKRYTPYGEPSDQNYVQGPGFTGHVTDAATGLTYAQQRYYDPILGRFLSPDPVQTDTSTGASFNRFNYANNNPYKFNDPDGRDTKVIINANTSWDPETWWGTHAGLYLDSSLEEGSSMLYDPNGSYNPGMAMDPPRNTRSSGGFFEGADGSLSDYIKYQKTDGPKVLLYIFKTTPEEEKQIALNIIELGDARGLTCATDVSYVLDGIGPFKGLGIQDTPVGLQAKLNELKRKQEKEQETKKDKKDKDTKDTKKDVKETKDEKK